MVAVELVTPVVQHAHEPARFNIRHQLVFRQQRDAESGQRCVHLERYGVEDQRAVDAYADLASALFEVPDIELEFARGRHALVGALMLCQVGRRPGNGMDGEVVG